MYFPHLTFHIPYFVSQILYSPSHILTSHIQYSLFHSLHFILRSTLRFPYPSLIIPTFRIIRGRKFRKCPQNIIFSQKSRKHRHLPRAEFFVPQNEIRLSESCQSDVPSNSEILTSHERNSPS